MRRTVSKTLAATAGAALLLPAGLVLGGSANAAGTDLAQGKTATASSVSQTYQASNITDGDQSTYWESSNDSLPQWVQVDLGSTQHVTDLVLQLPDNASWTTRTETVQVQTSTNGSSFSSLVGATGYTFDPASGNSVAVDTPDADARYVRLVFSANTGWPAGQLSGLVVHGSSAGGDGGSTGGSTGTGDGGTEGTLLSQGKTATASSGNAPYVASNLTDGAKSSYWEGTGGQFPQWAQVDLGQSRTVQRVALQLPDGWESRTETLAVSTSTDGSSFTTAKAAATYTFDPASGNTVNLDVPDQAARYVRVTVSANSGWNAAQLAELQVYGDDAGGGEPTDPGTTEPTDPGTTDPGTPTGRNVALGKTITASSVSWTYAATNANDGDVATYWEGAAGAYPSTLAVSLGSDTTLSDVVLELNPDSAWGARTQTLSIEGRAAGSSTWTTLKSSATYAFNPSGGNTVTIPVSGTASDVRLTFTANSGSSNGQVAELEVYGTPAPNPDLQVTSVTSSPANPVETDQVTLSAVVKNTGDRDAAASSVSFQLNGTTVATKPVAAIAAGGQATVTANVGALNADSYRVGATADSAGVVVEQDETDNAYTSPTALVVSAVPSSDLVPTVSWSPSTPAAGDTVQFTAVVANQGNVAAASGSHAITATVEDADGATVKTLTGSVSGAIAAGGNAQVSLGSWTAANGKYTVTVTVADDANEIAAKKANNTQSHSFFVGRGANMPYDTYEAEDGRTGGGAVVLGPNRTVGDLAGEASGRKAVALDQTGSYVEWTTKASTNTLVARFSIPDGTTSSVNVYVDGTFLKALPLTSAYAWLYGDETNPQNTPGSGAPRHVYDEANILLGTTVKAGSTIRLQKDAANTGNIAVDFVDLEQASQQANPDSSAYVEPTGFTQQAVQDALDKARQDTTGKIKGVYLPAGDYTVSNKFQVYGKALDIVGAGVWYTRFHSDPSQSDTDTGFRVDTTAQGSKFRDFAWFGNYVARIDGPGKVFDLTGVSNLTIDDIWVEHQVCAVWGTNVDDSTFTNMRIRDTFADGINLTNGSSGNRVANDEARSTGDDSFALFAAKDNGGTGESGNVLENLTAKLTWRAAGIAVYGGQDNTVRNVYVADTLVYAGITISSLNFGYSMEDFGPEQTVFDGVTLERDGGHFWGSQTFPAIWLFSASQKFTAIRMNDVDIIDPTYSGIMFQTNYVGSTPQNPIEDTVLTDVSITGAKKSGDAFDAKSGFGIWVNEQPEAGQGPAVGTATFNGLTFANNAQDIKNTTSTFTIVRN
ncbi:hypothetical protein GCM10023221_24110 [Luteimicrobium xylanilyticum]|uniref:F5/8 type C domain-containing protein n=1 Tax=Luteimicrobium xylanilyticum TaxID=1133546 RepID=A0A5P9Q6G7_9MICO|nr:discoidin domain-containing protein [Luteimicrobium xylanilyticum]QFU96662.1 hypothetical protein KDY119_00149 [Luteimicrobium xylanilyticum]